MEEIANIEPEQREELKSQGSETESDSEFDVKDDAENYADVAGLELPTSMINIDLDKFTSNMGIDQKQFRRVLKSNGGPFENGKVNPPAEPKMLEMLAPLESKKSMMSKTPADSISAMSNDESISKSEKKKQKKQTYWKHDEDLRLKELFEKYGNQWAEIQKFFPERTKEQIHNHVRHLKKSGKLDLIGTKEYEESKKAKGAKSSTKKSAKSGSNKASSVVSKDDMSSLVNELVKK